MLTPEQVADFTERMRATDSVFERVEIARAIEQAAASAAVDTFEFEHCGQTHSVRGDRESIKALLKWREEQRRIVERALRRTDTGGKDD